MFIRVRGQGKCQRQQRGVAAAACQYGTSEGASLASLDGTFTHDKHNGAKQLVNGETQLVNGETQLVNGETQLVDGETQLVNGETQAPSDGQRREKHKCRATGQ